MVALPQATLDLLRIPLDYTTDVKAPTGGIFEIHIHGRMKIAVLRPSMGSTVFHAYKSKGLAFAALVTRVAHNQYVCIGRHYCCSLAPVVPQNPTQPCTPNPNPPSAHRLMGIVVPDFRMGSSIVADLLTSEGVGPSPGPNTAPGPGPNPDPDPTLP